MDLRDVDLLDRDAFVDRVPHDVFDFLRAEHPVYRHPEDGGPGFWVLTRYEDVLAASRDWETFSSDGRRGGVVGLEEIPDEQRQMQEAMAEGLGEVGGMMLFMDPPGHTRCRKLVNRGFTPRMIALLEEWLRTLATTIVDDVIERGECDLVPDVVARLPLAAIAELLGIPESDRSDIYDWSNQMIGQEDPEFQTSPEAAMEASSQMFLYANNLAAERRANPGDDIVSKLVTADIDGHGLSDLEFDLFFLLLAVAGNETTRNALAHGALELMTFPEQWSRLLADPSLVPSAVEEILRFATPVMYFRRNVTRDIELHGRQIRAGDKISLWYTAANRDPSVFSEPHTFDVGRQPNEHLAFGAGGPHFCLGASLARMEMQVMLEELLRRMPDLELAGEPARLRSNFINGIKHLPVRFTASNRITHC